MNVQTPLTDAEYRSLGARLQEWPSIGVRFYGLQTGGLSFLQHFANLRRLDIDLPLLESFDGLASMEPNLEGLILGQTRRRCSLAPIARFSKLHGLCIWGHSREIDLLDGLPLLTTLILRSVKLDSVRNLSTFERLRNLTLAFGSSGNLNFLVRARSLRLLDISSIRLLTDLSVLADMPSLEVVSLSGLRKVSSLPSLARLQSLKWFAIDGMTNLCDLAPIAQAPNLVDFHAAAMTNLTLKTSHLSSAIDHSLG